MKIFGQEQDISNDLTIIKSLVAALPTTPMRGTDNAALASVWTSVLATALTNYTAVRAGYLEELSEVNIPADIGENDDGHDGATLFGRLRQLIEHIHSIQYVYPSGESGITVTTGANSWDLGTYSRIIPADTVLFPFDIHEILIEDVNIQDKTFELVLYHGPDNIECGRTRFAATSLKGGVPAVSMQTPIIPANHRIRAKLMVDGGGNKTAKVSVRYHLY